MHPFVILIIILVYFALLLLISSITGRRADSSSFYIGNRQSPWYIVSFGMIGASLSGITFISVPGWIITSKFYYMQMVLGYLLGYAVIVHVLLPLYYKLKLTSIYGYLKTRFGNSSYKTGAVFFLISRIIGASFRLFIVANVLQITIFNTLNVPFVLTILITLLFIYIYTFRGGIKTIVWTDTLQTLFMLSAVVVSIVIVSGSLDLDLKGLVSSIVNDEHSRMFNFTDWRKSSFFFKQFLSGAFITIVMTGLDQDMMQKNLSCRNLRDAQKNMYWYSTLLVPVNILFLSLGVLLVRFSHIRGIPLPEYTDDLFPMLATGAFMPAFLGVIFVLGLIAAAYSSADSAITALTTSITIDLFEAEHLEEKRLRTLRWRTHILVSLLIGVVIFVFRLLSNDAVISTLFKAAGYTYGPLLGLYAFGLFTKLHLRDRWVPVIAVSSPFISFLIKVLLEFLIRDYQASFEILVLNGFITFAGLLLISQTKSPTIKDK
ncbi:hypothetical protein ES705_19383 [subsurface metagenome]